MVCGAPHQTMAGRRVALLLCWAAYCVVSLPTEGYDDTTLISLNEGQAPEGEVFTPLQLALTPPPHTPQELVKFFGTLSAEWAIECLKELLVTNMRQNLQLVVQVAKP